MSLFSARMGPKSYGRSAGCVSSEQDYRKALGVDFCSVWHYREKEGDCQLPIEETEQLWKEGQSRKFSSIAKIALGKLLMLNNAHELRDLFAPPSNQLEKLKGDRAGQYSIRINDQYRICFHFHEGEAQNVEIVDYH